IRTGQPPSNISILPSQPSAKIHPTASVALPARNCGNGFSNSLNESACALHGAAAKCPEQVLRRARGLRLPTISPSCSEQPASNSVAHSLSTRKCYADMADGCTAGAQVELLNFAHGGT